MKIKNSIYSKRKAKARTTDTPFRKIRPFKIREVDPILAEIKIRRRDDPIRTALINYIIIRCVTVFESFMLNSVGAIVDSNKEKALKLFKDTPRKGIPLSHQIVSMYNFADIRIVNDVMTKLLGFDFLDAIKQESVKYYNSYYLEKEQVKGTKALHKNWDNILKIFDYRNEIVHHDRQFHFNYRDIRNLVGGTIQFTLCSILIVK